MALITHNLGLLLREWFQMIQEPFLAQNEELYIQMGPQDRLGEGGRYPTTIEVDL